MQAEAPGMRVEGVEWSCAADVRDPGPEWRCRSHLRDGAIGDAQQDELWRCRVEHDASLREPRGHRRADAPARADDLNTLDHLLLAPVPVSGYRAVEVCPPPLLLGKPRLEVGAHGRPFLVRDAVPRAVAILAVAYEHVVSVDPLERGTERRERRA